MSVIAAEDSSYNLATFNSRIFLIGWAIYLGVSWTWCIGMFLPILLVRDYGFWGYFVFAIPNVFGAAAMGWVLKDAEASKRFVDKHRRMVRLFSLVTIAFQAFFLLWLYESFLQDVVWMCLIACLVFLLPLIAFFERYRGLAVTVWCTSIVAVIWLLAEGVLHWPPEPAALPRSDALWLAFPCMLGFALCPYGDATFHLVRQATSPRGGRLAFGVGFLFFFAVMIVLTPFYADLIVNGSRRPRSVLAIHLIFQLLFTVIVHTGFALPSRRKYIGWQSPLWVGCYALLFIAGCVMLTRWNATYHGLRVGEIVYRVFLSFYGLIFPAYLLVTAGRRGPIERRDYGAWLLIVALMAPLFWRGFVDRQMIFAAIGSVGVVVLATLWRRGNPQALAGVETRSPSELLS